MTPPYEHDHGHRDPDDDEPFEIGEVEVVKETSDAIRVKIEASSLAGMSGTYRWFPKSVVHADSEVWNAKSNFGQGKLIVKTWFAKKEGIYDE